MDRGYGRLKSQSALRRCATRVWTPQIANRRCADGRRTFGDIAAKRGSAPSVSGSATRARRALEGSRRSSTRRVRHTRRWRSLGRGLRRGAARCASTRRWSRPGRPEDSEFEIERDRANRDLSAVIDLQRRAARADAPESDVAAVSRPVARVVDSTAGIAARRPLETHGSRWTKLLDASRGSAGSDDRQSVQARFECCRVRVGDRLKRRRRREADSAHRAQPNENGPR